MGNCLSISISVDEAVSRSWDSVAGRAQYICKLEQNRQALEAEAKRLTEQRDDVNRRVLLAKEQLMEPLKRVEGWLERVEKEIKEVEQMIEDAPAQINNLCLGGYLSKSCCSSYKFGKKTVQKTRDVANLRTEGDFLDVAERCPAASVVVRPSEPTVGLVSTFDKVWTSLTDESSNIIGIYGMGGVGKTTLLTQINNELQQRRNNFDIVIWATVSKNHTIGKVQDEIGRKIGYSDQIWKQKGGDEKANDILAELSKKKFVLLLDDIWERVDLVKVGIPIARQGHGSKLVFTTRSLDVCGQMEAHKKIVVDCLAPEKAWELFKIKVGEETLDSHPKIHGVAREMAEHCRGLPLALITIGRAMSSKKTLQQWEYARKSLRKSVDNHVLPGMREEVYPLLKFSYDSLPRKKLKSCFLYCALFAEDFLIRKYKLIDYWIGEGFLDEDNGICDRNEGYDIICTLCGLCLLEEVDDDQVKMHDVSRDMALWIASEIEKEKYRVETSARLTEAPEIENWGMIKRLSLMNNEIQCLRGTPDCPDLRTLFLQCNYLHSMRLGEDFFQNMVSLTVLDVSNNKGLTELPVGISNLVSLQCLNISSTSIEELPMELSSLSKLKCLNLEMTFRLETISEKLICGFSKLQVLRMRRTASIGAGRAINRYISSGRLECLKYLNALTMTILSDSALEGFLSSHHLKGCTEALDIELCKDDSLFSLKTLCLPPLKLLHFLSLESTSLEEVKIEWEKEGREIQTAYYFQTSVTASERSFYNLWSVEIQHCPNLKDITWIIFAPNLRCLSVSGCPGMEEIISEGGVAAMTGDLILFEKLKKLSLVSLPELKKIHRFALSFPCLDIIEIVHCPKLRKIPLRRNCEKGRRIIAREAQQWWNEIEWEDESTRDTFLLSFEP